MPLLDHFHPPLFPHRSWESFHGFWITHLAGNFNMRPNRYGFLAEVNIPNGVTVVREATEAGAPPQPFLVVPVDFSTLQTFEIRIYDEDRARTLVAVVELVSPGNKDRPENRRAFLDKCAAYLREGVSVVIVDIVTSRQNNFHADLMELLGGDEVARRAVTSDLYAVAYRVHLVGQRTQVEAWPENLALGAPLPTMPLWLTESMCVPLELEKAYQAECRYAGIG
jgi:hypothetical protein